MRKSALLLILCVGLSIVFNQCKNNNDPKPNIGCELVSLLASNEDGSKFVVKVETNSQSQITKYYTSDNAGNIDLNSYEEYTYENGKKVIRKRNITQELGGGSYSPPFKEIYKYNENLISKSEYYELRGDTLGLDNIYEYQYDADYNLVQMTYSKMEFSNNIGILRLKTKSEFKDFVNGRPTKKFIYENVNDSLVLKLMLFYEYDENMNRTNQTFEKVNGGSSNYLIREEMRIIESKFHPSILDPFKKYSVSDNPNVGNKDMDRFIPISYKSVLSGSIYSFTGSNFKTNSTGCLESYEKLITSGSRQPTKQTLIFTYK